LRAPDCAAPDRDGFQKWLDADVAHGHAYEAVVQTADRIAQQAQLDPRLRALAEAALKPAEKSQQGDAGFAFGKSLRTHWRSAAALVAGVGMAVYLAANVSKPVVDASPMANYTNTDNHERRIALSDGSVVHLDVASEVSVQMSAKARNITLGKGRAYFEVAHDSSRPFAVVAAGTRTVALGTRFEVSLLTQTVNVTLAEGSVAITDAKQPERWREMLRPGQQLRISSELDKRDRLEVNADTITSWSKGRLVFDGTPLAKALEDINRYASVKVYLGDSELANVPIGGNFVAGGDSNEFVETLAAVLPLRSARAGANEIVLFQRYENPNP
jgi:transmembrane sensor